MSRLVKAGRIGSAYGIKGWVNIQSFTSPSSNLFDYGPWRLDSGKACTFEQFKPHKKAFVAKIEGVDDRTAAEMFCPQDIWVDQAVLPSTADDEFYWHQLESLKVISEFDGNSVCLGRVKKLLATGSNDVLVVEPIDVSEGVEPRERLIPFINEFTGPVDFDAQTITVYWDPEF